MSKKSFDDKLHNVEGDCHALKNNNHNHNHNSKRSSLGNEIIQFVEINSNNIYDVDLNKLDIRRVNNHVGLKDICSLYYYFNKNPFSYMSEKKPTIPDMLSLENFYDVNSELYPTLIQEIKVAQAKENVKEKTKTKEEKNTSKNGTNNRAKIEVDHRFNKESLMNCTQREDKKRNSIVGYYSVSNFNGDYRVPNSNEDSISDVSNSSSSSASSSCSSRSSRSSSASSSSILTSSASSSSSTSMSSLTSSNISDCYNSNKNNETNQLVNLKHIEIIKKNIENKGKTKKKKKEFKTVTGKYKRYDAVLIQGNRGQSLLSQIYKILEVDNTKNRKDGSNGNSNYNSGNSSSGGTVPITGKRIGPGSGTGKGNGTGTGITNPIQIQRNVNVICQWIYGYKECKKYIYNNFDSHLSCWNVVPCLGYFNKNKTESITHKIEVYNIYEFLYLFDDFPVCLTHNNRFKPLTFQKTKERIKEKGSSGEKINFKKRKEMEIESEIEREREKEKEDVKLDILQEENRKTEKIKKICNVHEDGEEENKRRKRDEHQVKLEEENDFTEEEKEEEEKEKVEKEKEKKLIKEKEGDYYSDETEENKRKSSSEKTEEPIVCIYDEDIIYNENDETVEKRNKRDCSFQVFFYENFLYGHARVFPFLKKNCVILNRKSENDLNFFINANLYKRITDKSNIFYEENNDYILCHKSFEFLYFFCFNCKTYYDINIIFFNALCNVIPNATNNLYRFLQKYKKLYNVKIKRQRIKQTDIYFICSNCLHNNVNGVSEHTTYFYYFCDMVNMQNHNFQMYNEYVKKILSVDAPFFSFYNITKEMALLAKKNKLSLRIGTSNAVASKKRRNNNYVFSSKKRKEQEAGETTGLALDTNISMIDGYSVGIEISDESFNDVKNGTILKQENRDIVEIEKKNSSKKEEKSLQENANKKNAITAVSGTENETAFSRHSTLKDERKMQWNSSFMKDIEKEGNFKVQKKNISNEENENVVHENVVHENIVDGNVVDENLVDENLVDGNLLDENLGDENANIWSTAEIDDVGMANERGKRTRKKRRSEDDEYYHESDFSSKSEDFYNDELDMGDTDEEIVEEGQILNEEIYSDDSFFEETIPNEKKKRRRKKNKRREHVGKTTRIDSRGTYGISTKNVKKGDAITNQGKGKGKGKGNENESGEGRKKYGKKKNDLNSLENNADVVIMTGDFNADTAAVGAVSTVYKGRILRGSSDKIGKERGIMEKRSSEQTDVSPLDEKELKRKKKEKRKESEKEKEKGKIGKGTGNEKDKGGGLGKGKGKVKGIVTNTGIGIGIGQEKKTVDNMMMDTKEIDLQRYKKIIDKIKQSLDSQNKNPENDTLNLSKKIVEEVIKSHENRMDIKMKLFSISTNLLRKDNSELRRKILEGIITCSELANMNVVDLAPISLQKKREEHERKYFYESIYLREDFKSIKKGKNAAALLGGEEEEETYLPNVINADELNKKEQEFKTNKEETEGLIEGDEDVVEVLENTEGPGPVTNKVSDNENKKENLIDGDLSVRNISDKGSNESNSVYTKMKVDNNSVASIPFFHSDSKNIISDKNNLKNVKHEVEEMDNKKQVSEPTQPNWKIQKNSNPLELPSVEKYNLEKIYEDIKSIYTQIPKYAGAPILTYLQNSYKRINDYIAMAKKK